MTTAGGTKLEVSAHRGARQEAPENTWEAIRSSVELGIDRIEMDVRQSRDGVLYDFHDATLGKKTDGSGLFLLRGSGYIDSLDAGSWFSPDFAGARIPRVEEIVAELRGKVGFYFDVKWGVSVPGLVKLIRSHGIEKETYVSFVDLPAMQRRFSRQAPEIRVKYNVESIEHLRRGVPRGVSLVECDAGTLTPEYVELAHSKGLEVVARCHRESADEYRKALALGVGHANVDNPKAFMEFVHGQR